MCTRLLSSSELEFVSRRLSLLAWFNPLKMLTVPFSLGVRVTLIAGRRWIGPLSDPPVSEPVPLDESLVLEVKSSISKEIEAFPEGGDTS